MLTVLAIAAFVAGVAGAWSPCGFSMVDTLAPHGYAGSMRLTVLSCITFAAGALGGAVATFGGLALLGAMLGTGHGGAVAVTAALLLAAAAGDAGGRRIVPQVRRQVPESWRRVLPIAIAAGLYGVLLGLAFTTFVLSFAVYALAAACLALGDPAIGLAVGLGFAAGRIVPVVALAPLQQTERGIDLAAAMAERPGALRAIRAAGALAMSIAALTLALGGSPASAARERLLTADGTDPSAAAGAVAWQLPGGGTAFIRRDGETPQPLPGTDPALGPDNVVWRDGASLVVADRSTLGERLRIAAPGAEEPAVSARWLVWRARENASDVLRVLDLQAPGEPPVTLRSVRAPGRIGRPSIDADRAVYHVALPDESKIEEIYLPTRRRTTLRRGRSSQQLLNPSELGGTLLYVRASSERQQALIGPRRARNGRRDHGLYTIRRAVRPDAGYDRGRKPHGEGYPGGRPPRRPERPSKSRTVTLWSTALAPRAAYVSRIRRTAKGATTVILTLSR